MYKAKKNLDGLVIELKLNVNRGFHLSIYIWKDFESMYKNIDDEPDYLAHYIGLPYRINLETEEPELEEKVGEIHLVESKFGAGVFAHELQHFILDWIDIWGLDDDEAICTIAGKMTTDFWNTFYEHFEKE